MNKVFGTDVSTDKPAKPSSAGMTKGWFRIRSFLDFPTRIYCWWMNMVQSELLSALTACGITPDDSDEEQLGKCFDKKFNVSGGTIRGPTTFNSSAPLTLNGGLQIDANTIAAAKFDEYIDFTRTFPAISAMAIDPEWTFVSTYGAIGCTTKNKEIGFPIPHIPGCRLRKVEALMQNRDSSQAHTVRLRLMQRLYSATDNAGEIGNNSEEFAASSFGYVAISGTAHSPTPTPPSADPYISDTVMTNINSRNNYFALIDITGSGAIGTGVFCLGLRVTYKREQIAT